MNVKIKRAYDQSDRDDGTRILVDRLWPRGLTKEKAKIDLWLKEIAPTTELRKWFGHAPDRWEGFKKRYVEELEQNEEATAVLKEKIEAGPVTLVYAASDERHNHARVILESAHLFL